MVAKRDLTPLLTSPSSRPSKRSHASPECAHPTHKKTRSTSGFCRAGDGLITSVPSCRKLDLRYFQVVSFLPNHVEQDTNILNFEMFERNVDPFDFAALLARINGNPS